MKTAGWAGLFIASFLAGHFVANPWLYPVGKILLFIEIYISALAAFIILNQIIPYVWRTLSKWQIDFQQSPGLEDQSLSWGMRLSFAAAGLSSALEKGKKETSPQPEPMPRNLSAIGDGAVSTAVTLLNATVGATGKKEIYKKEPDSFRKLVLLPPIKANPEKNSDQVISGDNAESSAESSDESIATCEAVTAEKANTETAIAVEEMATVIIIEDRVETESIATDEAVHAPYDDILADTREILAETAEIIAPVEVSEELKAEELEFEELEPLAVESDVSVESVPPARVIRRPESELLERFLAMDATGIAAETMDKAEESVMDTISFEAEEEDFAVEGTDLSFFSEPILRGGVANGSLDKVAAANEEIAEIIEIAETVEDGTNIMAAEESIGSSRTEQDLRDHGSVDQQYQELELSLEQDDENLAMDNSPESEFECVFVEETGESSGFDIVETVELAQTEVMADISTDAGSFEPVECGENQTIEAAPAGAPPETVRVDDIIELRPVGVPVTIQNKGKGEERFEAIPHSYSCRLRCQKPGGLFQGPILGFYCRFVCRHGNY